MHRRSIYSCFQLQIQGSWLLQGMQRSTAAFDSLVPLSLPAAFFFWRIMLRAPLRNAAGKLVQVAMILFISSMFFSRECPLLTTVNQVSTLTLYTLKCNGNVMQRRSLPKHLKRALHLGNLIQLWCQCSLHGSWTKWPSQVPSNSGFYDSMVSRNPCFTEYIEIDFFFFFLNEWNASFLMCIYIKVRLFTFLGVLF